MDKTTDGSGGSNRFVAPGAVFKDKFTNTFKDMFTNMLKNTNEQSTAIRAGVNRPPPKIPAVGDPL